jgi:hypothetical protein
MELPFPEDVKKWTWETVMSLPNQESQYLEYKQSLHLQNNSAAEQNEWYRELEQEFAAFANASGGILVFGVNDDGEPRPFEPPEHELKQSVTRIYQNTRPHIDVEIPTPINTPGDEERYVLPVRIREATRKPVMTSESAIYARTNDRKDPMNLEQIEALFVEHDRRQQAIRQLEMEIDQFYNTFHGQDRRFSARTPSPPNYHLVNIQSLKEVLRENTHLYSDEEIQETISKVFTALRNVEDDEVYFGRTMGGYLPMHEDEEEQYYRKKRDDLNDKLDRLERELTKLAEQADLDVKLVEETD